MTITAEFDTLEEMMGFAKRLVENEQADKSMSSEVEETPVAVDQEQPKAQPVGQAQPAVQAQPVAQPQAPTQQIAPVQTTAPSYTMDDLTKAAMTLMDSGRQPDLLNLLSQFGVDALPALPKEKYGAFATALRGLGAQI